MLRVLLATGLIFASAVVAGPIDKLPPKEAASVEPVHPMYLGSLNTGIKVNDAYTEGNFSIVAPVWSSLGADATLSGGLLFIEPYISWGEQGEVASSLGLGYRHLIGCQSVDVLAKHDGHQASFLEEGVVLGANLFVDMLDTETNHQFWQLGVGAEVLTRYVEVRGNYYIPLTDKKEVGSIRTEETFQTASQQTSTVAGDPFATGNSILQPYSQVTTQTTTTTTIERLFRRYEEGMEGWDLEVGLLIPWVDRYMDAKVIGGYYSFDNQPFGPQSGGAGNVEGWKAGLELRPVPAVVLNGTWYEDERLTGSDWTLSMRLEIPFEAGDLGDGKDLWSRVGDSFKPRRRHLVERMAEPVRRQNAAVKIARSTEEDTEEQQTSVKRVTKVVSQSQGQLVLADDVVFVNDGPAVGNGIQAGSTTGNGTAERPVLTIQEGANLAGPRSIASGRVWSVYTQGVTGKVYPEDVAVIGSMNFIGSGKRIAGLGGKSFGAGPAPFLIGGFSATGTGTETLGVSGYIIGAGTSATGNAIEVTDLRSLVVDSNTFVGTSDCAVFITQNGNIAASAVITGNTFLGNGCDDINVATYDGSLTLAATNNVFRDSFFGPFFVESFGGSTINFTATGNSMSFSGSDAFTLGSYDGSTFNAVISGNVITDSGLGGLFAAANDTSIMDITVAGNTIARVLAAGIDVSTLLGDQATLTVTVVNNHVSFTGGPGIAVGNMGNLSTMTATIAGNTVSVASFDSVDPEFGGIHMELWEGTSTTAFIIGNRVSTVFGGGVQVHAMEDSTGTFVIAGNVISQTATAGIDLQAVDSATLTVNSFAKNFVSLADLDGLHFFTDDVATIDIKNFNGNSISNSTDNSIFIEDIAGTVKLNGTTNNLLGSKGLMSLDFVTGPTGDVILNGVPVLLPTVVP